MTRAAYRAELLKLIAQRRALFGLLGAAIVPLAFAVGLAISPPKPGGEQESIFQGYVAASGLAIPLVALFFSSLFILPLLAALVAGDIVASETQIGTMKTILTRSVDRTAVFVAKTAATLTYVFAALGIFALVGALAGGILGGFAALPTPGGGTPVAETLLRIVLAFGLYALPLSAVACFGVMLSTLTRNSAAAIVGTLIAAFLVQIPLLLPGISTAVTDWLLSGQFRAYEQAFDSSLDGLELVRTAVISALWALPPLLIAWRRFVRIDVS